MPTFGDRLSGTISIEKERKLGQQFLRSLRAQAPILDDPILQVYLEHLIYRLAVHSELEDKRIDLVLIKNQNINAFAAPGGIIGLHHGLFLYGETEHELSAILSHELAHLSQRHFARRLDESKKKLSYKLSGVPGKYYSGSHSEWGRGNGSHNEHAGISACLLYTSPSPRDS